MENGTFEPPFIDIDATTASAIGTKHLQKKTAVNHFFRILFLLLFSSGRVHYLLSFFSLHNWSQTHPQHQNFPKFYFSSVVAIWRFKNLPPELLSIQNFDEEEYDEDIQYDITQDQLKSVDPPQTEKTPEILQSPQPTTPIVPTSRKSLGEMFHEKPKVTLIKQPTKKRGPVAPTHATRDVSNPPVQLLKREQLTEVKKEPDVKLSYATMLTKPKEEPRKPTPTVNNPAPAPAPKTYPASYSTPKAAPSSYPAPKPSPVSNPYMEQIQAFNRDRNQQKAQEQLAHGGKNVIPRVSLSRSKLITVRSQQRKLLS